jgi:hypothetical protein
MTAANLLLKFSTSMWLYLKNKQSNSVYYRLYNNEEKEIQTEIYVHVYVCCNSVHSSFKRYASDIYMTECLPLSFR